MKEPLFWLTSKPDSLKSVALLHFYRIAQFDTVCFASASLQGYSLKTITKLGLFSTFCFIVFFFFCLSFFLLTVWCENVHYSSDQRDAHHVLLTAVCQSQVSIAVGLVGFACFLLLILFVLINKYGRRSKFGMKGKSALIVGQIAERWQLAVCRVALQSCCGLPSCCRNSLYGS